MFRTPHLTILFSNFKHEWDDARKTAKDGNSFVLKLNALHPLGNRVSHVT